MKRVINILGVTDKNIKGVWLGKPQQRLYILKGSLTLASDFRDY